MRRIVAISLLLVGAQVARAAAVVRHGVREVYDVRYNYSWSTRHKLDLFVPDDLTKKEKRPVVLFVHGGTWMVGDKNFFGIYRNVGRALARTGLVAVMINYRLSPIVKHPEHVKDVALAFSWVRQNVEKHGGDPDRIILAGHSAGAHLVSLLATDNRYLKDPKLHLDDEDLKALRGVVSISGVYRIPGPDEFQVMAQRTIHHLVGGPGSGKLTSPLAPALMMISGPCNPFHLVFGKDDDVQKTASPIHHVRPGLPPFLMLNAESEVAGLHGMANDFYKELKKNGVPVEHHDVDGTTHRTIVKRLHSTDDKTMKLITAFVKRYAE